jgi:hypothetical protein
MADASIKPQAGIMNCTIMPTPTKKKTNPIKRRLRVIMKFPPRSFIVLYTMRGVFFVANAL